MRISDWSSDVCSSDLTTPSQRPNHGPGARPRTMRHPPGSSSRHSGLNSSRLWLVQPKRCAVKNHTNSISAASTTQRTQNGSATPARSEEHTSELQSLMRISYAVFCLKKKKTTQQKQINKHKQQK